MSGLRNGGFFALSPLHGRWRRRLSLLVAGVLDGPEQEATLRHLEGCARCRAEKASLESVLHLVAADPLRQAALPLSLEALVARVEARLDEAPRARRLRPALGGSPFLLPLAAAAAVLLGVTVLLRAPRPLGGPAPGSSTVAESTRAVEADRIALSEDSLRRLERTVAREQTARYLNEAQDLLVTVATSLPHCDRAAHRVDVSDEARRSRDLLARRSLLDLGESDAGSDDVASVRPVLQDVEQVLREVAALDPCVRPADLFAIQQAMEQRRLLMKIDLMTRELVG